jgi:hypothetical protein
MLRRSGPGRPGHRRAVSRNRPITARTLPLHHRGGDPVSATLFRCGRCGRRYSNPLTHTCATRMDRKRPAGTTRLSPQASRTCGTCGQPYANPLTHICTVRTDFKKRQAAAARQQKQARAAKARKQKATLTHQRKRERAAAARQRQRDRAKARRRAATTPTGKPAGTGRAKPRQADNHDYRQCYYDSLPDRGRAAQDCDRFPCRIYREGRAHGWDDGYSRGYATGYAEGYEAGYRDGYERGFPDGIAACPRPHENG